MRELSDADKMRLREKMLCLRLALRRAGAEQAARWAGQLANRRSRAWSAKALELAPLVAGYRMGVWAGAATAGPVRGRALERLMLPLTELLELVEALSGVPVAKSLIREEQDDD